MASDITVLLNACRDGDAGAFDELTQLIYPELKAMARRRSGGSALSATTLVNETFLKLLSGGTIGAEDRQQFFALAATIMRRVIVDEIRHVTAAKRSAPEVTFDDERVADEAQANAEFLIQVDRVLDLLAQEDDRLARVFECRYFAGFSTAETAQALSVSERTAERLWSASRARMADLISESF